MTMRISHTWKSSLTISRTWECHCEKSIQLTKNHEISILRKIHAWSVPKRKLLSTHSRKNLLHRFLRLRKDVQLTWDRFLTSISSQADRSTAPLRRPPRPDSKRYRRLQASRLLNMLITRFFPILVSVLSKWTRMSLCLNGVLTIWWKERVQSLEKEVRSRTHQRLIPKPHLWKRRMKNTAEFLLLKSLSLRPILSSRTN